MLPSVASPLHLESGELISRFLTAFRYETARGVTTTVEAHSWIATSRKDHAAGLTFTWTFGPRNSSWTIPQGESAHRARSLLAMRIASEPGPFRTSGLVRARHFRIWG